MESVEQFWTQVAVYNQTMWPVMLAMTILAAFLTFRVFLRPGGKTNTWRKAFLSFAFAWNGLVELIRHWKTHVEVRQEPSMQARGTG